jgi:hypothetical protein
LALPNTDETKKWFKDEKVQDVLFVHRLFRRNSGMAYVKTLHYANS